jgi:hypothetical protein
MKNEVIRGIAAGAFILGGLTSCDVSRGNGNRQTPVAGVTETVRPTPIPTLPKLKITPPVPSDLPGILLDNCVVSNGNVIPLHDTPQDIEVLNCTTPSDDVPPQQNLVDAVIVVQRDANGQPGVVHSPAFTTTHSDGNDPKKYIYTGGIITFGGETVSFDLVYGNLDVKREVRDTGNNGSNSGMPELVMGDMSFSLTRQEQQVHLTQKRRRYLASAS